VGGSTTSIFAGVATRAQRRGELGENDPYRQAPSVSDGDAVTEGRQGSRVVMG
jgi:hypothetical protein